MDKLKPCPFCNCPELTVRPSGAIRCDLCDSEAKHDKQWNMRPDSPLTPGTLIGGRKVIAVVEGAVDSFFSGESAYSMGGYVRICDPAISGAESSSHHFRTRPVTVVVLAEDPVNVVERGEG